MSKPTSHLKHITIIGLSFFVSISTVYGNAYAMQDMIPNAEKTSKKIVNNKVNPKTIATLASVTNSPIEVKEDVLEENLPSLTSSLSFVEENSIEKPIITEGGSGSGREKVIDYTVEDGDTIWSIAKKFEITTGTVKWANNLADVDSIKPGQVLKIIHISGTLHKVNKGEDLVKIASFYSAGISQIMEENGLISEEIIEGQILVIPGGVKPEPKVKSNKENNPAKNKGKTSNAPRYAGSSALKNSSGWLIRPTRGIKTQGFHCNNGIDIADTSMPPVWAAAAGQVIYTGWAGDYGLTVKIRHSNGVVTQYSHLNKIYVKSGSVGQGQIIGQMGRTGRVYGRTGIHLHFEVHGARNPF